MEAEALCLGLGLRGQDGRAEEARREQARGEELLQGGGGLLGPGLNLGRDAGDQGGRGGGAGLRCGCCGLVVLEAQDGDVGVLEGVEGGCGL